MEPESPRSSNSSALAWFVAGSALGLAAALLFAPDKGVHTRRKLAGHFADGSQSLRDSSQDLIDRGRQLFEQGRQIAQEAADMFERGRRMAEENFNSEHQETAEPSLDRGL